MKNTRGLNILESGYWLIFQNGVISAQFSVIPFPQRRSKLSREAETGSSLVSCTWFVSCISWLATIQNTNAVPPYCKSYNDTVQRQRYLNRRIRRRYSRRLNRKWPDSINHSVFIFVFVKKVPLMAQRLTPDLSDPTPWSLRMVAYAPNPFWVDRYCVIGDCLMKTSNILYCWCVARFWLLLEKYLDLDLQLRWWQPCARLSRTSARIV